MYIHIEKNQLLKKDQTDKNYAALNKAETFYQKKKKKRNKGIYT
jgi:hypothetical protein